MTDPVTQTGLVKYDAMQRAIAEAVAVDEVKPLRDKALALEKYAQQARNFEAERRAAQIRIRAELRGGQLLKEMEKATGSRNQLKGSDASGARIARAPENSIRTLAQLGVSHDQSSRWQQLAANPQAVERYLAEEQEVPTTAGALAAVAGVRGNEHGVEPASYAELEDTRIGAHNTALRRLWQAHECLCDGPDIEELAAFLREEQHSFEVQGCKSARQWVAQMTTYRDRLTLLLEKTRSSTPQVNAPPDSSTRLGLVAAQPTVGGALAPAVERGARARSSGNGWGSARRSTLLVQRGLSVLTGTTIPRKPGRM